MKTIFLTLEESQKLISPTLVPKSEPSPVILDSKLSEEKPPGGEQTADLGQMLSDVEQKVMSSGDEKPLQQRFSATSSVGEEDGSLCGSEMGDDHDSANNGERMRTISGGQSHSGNSSQNKRYRTNLTNMQIHVMKYIFKDYKTPTMAECEVLGSFIGLQKRVVQVWFQNARAKEKKSKLVNSNGDEDPLVTECLRCGISYSPKYSIQEHIFSARHINQLRSVFNGKLTECDREAMRKQAEVKITLLIHLLLPCWLSR